MVELARRKKMVYERAAINEHRNIVEQGIFDEIPTEERFFPKQLVVTRHSHIAFTVLADLGDKLKLGYKEDTKYVIKEVFKIDARSVDSYLHALNKLIESDTLYQEGLKEIYFSRN